MLSLVALVNLAQVAASLKGSGITFRHTNSAVVTFPIKDHLCTSNALAVGILSANLKKQGIRHRVIRWHVGYGIWGKAVIVPNGFFL